MANNTLIGYRVTASEYAVKVGNHLRLAKLAEAIVEVVAPVLRIERDDVWVHIKKLSNGRIGQTTDNGLIDMSPKMLDILDEGEDFDPVRAWIVTLCHELVHVAQFKHKRLRCATKYMIWNGKKFLFKRIQESYVAYINVPWEQEAWGLQKELADMFIASKKGAETLKLIAEMKNAQK